MSLAVVKSRQVPWHRAIVAGATKPTGGVPYGATLFEYVAGSSPPIGSWWVFTEAGWVPESVPGLSTVYVHTIAPTVVDPAAAQTDVVTIDGVACSFTSDATPTAAEIVAGLQAAIAASTAVGKFVVSGTTTLILTPATSYSPVVSVSANLTDVLTIGAPVTGSVTISSALPAGEAHIGMVGGDTHLVSITPVVTAGAYHANDIVGGTGAGAGLGINTIANAARVSGGSGIIQSLLISDLATQNAVLEIYLFSANPAAGAYTDNGALDLHDTDALLCIGRIDVGASDYKSLADNSIAMITSIGIAYKLAATSMFAIIRTTGTPTYAGVSDLQLTFGLLRD